MEEVFREALNLSKKGESYVIATVVDTKGSTPQKPGAKLLVREDGSGVGTLGGGCVEGVCPPGLHLSLLGSICASRAPSEPPGVYLSQGFI